MKTILFACKVPLSLMMMWNVLLAHKAQADADYDDSFDPGEVSETDGDSGSGDEGGDPLFEEAKALVIETQKASASMIQRVYLLVLTEQLD